jgi:hypothetical protein
VGRRGGLFILVLAGALWGGCLHRSAAKQEVMTSMKKSERQISAVLELPPVKNANDAVEVHIVQQAKQTRKG